MKTKVIHAKYVVYSYIHHLKTNIQSIPQGLKQLCEKYEKVFSFHQSLYKHIKF